MRRHVVGVIRITRVMRPLWHIMRRLERVVVRGAVTLGRSAKRHRRVILGRAISVGRSSHNERDTTSPFQQTRQWSLDGWRVGFLGDHEEYYVRFACSNNSANRSAKRSWLSSSGS